MRSIIILCLFSCVLGCSQRQEGEPAQPDKSMWEKTKGLFGKSPEEMEKERESNTQNLLATDSMVESWANRLSEDKKEDGSFMHYEGVLELDVWNNPIRVEYVEDTYKEEMVVRSAGPDGRYKTSDDLKRTVISEKKLGISQQLELNVAPILPIVVAWVFVGIVAVTARTMRSKKQRSSGALALEGLIFLVAGPIMLVVWLFVGITEHVFNADWDFDFFE